MLVRDFSSPKAHMRAGTERRISLMGERIRPLCAVRTIEESRPLLCAWRLTTHPRSGSPSQGTHLHTQRADSVRHPLALGRESIPLQKSATYSGLLAEPSAPLPAKWSQAAPGTRSTAPGPVGRPSTGRPVPEGARWSTPPRGPVRRSSVGDPQYARPLRRSWSKRPPPRGRHRRKEQQLRRHEKRGLMVPR